jgi:hypothetical protein
LPRSSGARYRFRYTDLPQALKADPRAMVVLPIDAAQTDPATPFKTT